MTPLFVSSSALGLTLTDVFISWKAAVVSLICKLIIDLPSKAGWYSKIAGCILLQQLVKLVPSVKMQYNIL